MEVDFEGGLSALTKSGRPESDALPCLLVPIGSALESIVPIVPAGLTTTSAERLASRRDLRSLARQTNLLHPWSPGARRRTRR